MEKPLDIIARELKIDILRMFYQSKTGHLAPALSCIDILTVIYFSIKKECDKFILSKGHGAAALYAVLAKANIINPNELKTFYKYNSKLLALASFGLNGIDLPTGSLGQGFCFATGIAKAYQLDELDAYVYCLLGDGEMQEGCVWEAALFAAAQKLNNFITILDNNNIQASGYTSEISSIDPIKEKWESFGWNVYETNGHDLTEIGNILKKAKLKTDKPSMIIAHTIKGNGISFIADKNNCHTLLPKDEEWNQVCKEFNILLEELKDI